MHRRATVVLFLCLAALSLFVAYWRPGRDQTSGSAREVAIPVESSGDPEAGAKQSPEGSGKVRQRETLPKLSDDELISILATPFPEPVGFPAQSLEERIKALNELLRRSGPPANRVRVEIHKRTEDAGVMEWKLPALEPQERLSDIMEKSATELKIRYRVFEGRLEFVAVG